MTDPDSVDPRTEDYHIGRSWAGTPLEDECPCEQELCGLVQMSKANPDCPQHAIKHAKSMRQIHRADSCPAVTTKEPA